MEIIKKIAAKQANIVSEKPITIAFLGDSVTQGCFECYTTLPNYIETEFDYTSAFSTRVREIFNFLYPNVQINIINSGISGDSAQGGLKRIERDILAYNPDLVVVGYALNDSFGREEGLENYRKTMTEIINKIKSANSECILLTPNMMNTVTSFHIKDEFIKEFSLKTAEVQNSGILDKYVECIREIGKAEGVKVCDVYAKWRLMANGGVNITELLANKLNHPKPELHYLTAAMLVECMLG